MTKHNTLRKAAILITALDTRSADALLEQMPESYANRVREAVFELDEIDPEEQQQILSEFLHSTGRSIEASSRQTAASSSRSADDTVELVLSSETESPRMPSVARPPQTRPTVEVDTYHNRYQGGRSEVKSRPFDFLGELSGAQLARMLSCEHPQTIAVVVAHLPARRAAELVGEFPATLQAEVLRRVADLTEVDAETLGEMEQELRRSFEATRSSASSPRVGVSTVSSILAAAGETRTTLLRNMQQHDQRLANDVGYELPANGDSSSAIKDDPWESDWDSLPALTPAPRDLGSEIEAHRRLALSAQQFGQWQTPTEESSENAELQEEIAKPHNPTVQWTFADLDSLSDRDLARVLQSAASELTMVALAGAEPAFVARLTNQLPPALARQFSHRIETVGPLQLRDIEAAQRKIAEIAGALAEQGVIQQKPTRPFAMAA